MVMLVPLMILALLSVVGGLVGIGNGFEHFLAPVFGIGIRRTAGEAAGSGNRMAADGHLGAGRVLGPDPRLHPLCQQAVSPAENRRRL